MASSSSNSSQLFLRRHMELKESVMEIFDELLKRVDDRETIDRNKLRRKIGKAFQAQGQSDQVNDDPVQMAKLFLRRHRELKESVMTIFDESFNGVDDRETIDRNKLQREIGKAFQAERREWLEKVVRQYTQTYEESMCPNRVWISNWSGGLFQAAEKAPGDQPSQANEQRVENFFKEHEKLKAIAMSQLDDLFDREGDDKTIKKYKKRLRRKIESAFQKIIYEELEGFEENFTRAYENLLRHHPPARQAVRTIHIEADVWFPTFLERVNRSCDNPTDETGWGQWKPIIEAWREFRAKFLQFHSCASHEEEMNLTERSIAKDCVSEEKRW